MTTEKTDPAGTLRDVNELRREVTDIVKTAPVIDVHTHLLPPVFGEQSLFGIDELLTYHYLIAETLRSTVVTPAQFWNISKSDQADLVWKTLFVDNTPLSEATRGVVTVLTSFGLDPNSPDLAEARAFFSSRNINEHLDFVLGLAGVTDVVMTNELFNAQETSVWESGVEIDHRFHAALRLDRLTNDWPHTAARLSQLGYQVDANRSSQAASEMRRFLGQRIAALKPVCMAASLPAEFKFPCDNDQVWMLREVVLPAAREHELALALMIGVRRGVNPALRAAGDGMAKADVGSLERLCGEYPEVRFLATYLSRENQHELCVAARKFGNLMPFGCWWFLNNPSIVSEVTQERLELLGTRFIPQHSDARILEQLIYKWQHSRDVIASCLCQSYEHLLQSGRAVTKAEIKRDVSRLFAGNFREWVGGMNARTTAGAPADSTRQPEDDVVTTY